jgi:rSAM/selenodomain-associated transferase 1
MTQNQDCCILLFVKYPQKGQVKQRLAADLSEEIVQEVYRCFVHDTIKKITPIDAQLIVCFQPATAQKQFQKWLGSTMKFLPQQGTDLGERMKNSFSSAFTQGYRRVLLMGSDSPDLPESFLHNAFSELQTHEVVLGPSVDGGYYLIGFRDTTFTPRIFEGIPWSTPTVFQETMKKIKEAHKSVSTLPVWSDVDTLTDLQNLITRSKHTAFKSSDTITFLQQQNIPLEKAS